MTAPIDTTVHAAPLSDVSAQACHAFASHGAPAILEGSSRGF